MRYIGRLGRCYYERRFGYIRVFYSSRDVPRKLLDNDIFFSFSDYIGKRLQKGIRVTFDIAEINDKPAAVNITDLERKITAVSQPV